jgi:ribosomal protein S18 acetylase RimI-like enzyme
MNISVFRAGLKDAELISKLSVETFYETYSWYNTPENMRDYTQKHFNPEQTKKDISTPHTYFLLAKITDETVGYAKLRVFEHPEEFKGKRHIEIERIYVQKAYQDKKAGYALMQKCIELAREKGFEVIWLGVWEKNSKAMEFYKKAGFESFGVHNFQLGDDAQKDYLLKLSL